MTNIGVTFLSGLIFSLTLTIRVQAADADFCDQYARQAIQQQVANVAQRCGKTGLRWSPLYEEQKAWCLTVRQPVAKQETQARQDALQRCGTTAAPIAWDTLRDPAKWDALFAEEMVAIKKDDALSIQVMHEHGVDISYDEGFNNGTALYHAIDQQAGQVARYLVRQGVNPNRTTNGGINPLTKMLNDATVDLSLLQFLLNNGADPNSYGEFPGSLLPLEAAFKKGNLAAATILLNAGADPDQHDAFLTAPLLVRAIQQRNLDAVVLLVNRGANVNLGRSETTCRRTRNRNALPLDEALAVDFTEAVQLLKNRGAKTSAECRAG